MIELSRYIMEKAMDFGNKELVSEFKATKNAIVKVTYKPSDVNGLNIIYLHIDLWNNTLVCRIGITKQGKYCVAVWRDNNKSGLDLGPRKNSLIPFLNGDKYDSFHMGGKIQYSFNKEEFNELKKALEEKNKDLIDKINKTIEAVDEYN